MANEYNTVTITTSATEIVDANNGRTMLLLANDGTAKIYIGPDANITTSNGIPMFQGEKLTRDHFPEGYKGAIYGIVSSGTVDVRYWEYTGT